MKSLFEQIGDDTIEGYIKIRGKIYQFCDREELDKILRNNSL